MEWTHIFLVIIYLLSSNINAEKYYSKDEKLFLRERVREMFYHAYDNYVHLASDFDELRPLTCDGIDTWGSYSLTLVDALDTLAIMGNFSEFRRVTEILETKLNFDRDINVSVFETNIRIIGGLLSAHFFSERAGIAVEKGWPCQGPLLRLAEDLAHRLLPAFDTDTGMPYGTVNLRYGVPKGETPVTCTAGVGTFLVEFGALSRLTGNMIFEETALNAVYALWERRSALGLFGNHIDVQSGRWTALDAGIGAGVDSFYEYLVKGATILNRPNLLNLFHESRQAIDKYLKRDDWYIWANMHKGQATLPVFQSLEAFWPGVLGTIGDISPAMRTLINYYSVWEKYGFLPEFFNIATMQVAANRESYPLRPELAESIWHLYKATKNPFLLKMGETIVNSIYYNARTKCGYATIRNVLTHEKENRMESFFLAETAKYLYLLFDEENFMHMEGVGKKIQTHKGECVVNAGSYVFNTEAHPVDMSAMYCCHNKNNDYIAEDFDMSQFSNEMLIKFERENIINVQENKMRSYNCPNHDQNNNKKEHNNVIQSDGKISKGEKRNEQEQISVDIEVYDEDNQPVSDLLVQNFNEITKSLRDSRVNQSQKKENILNNIELSVKNLQTFFSTDASDFVEPEQALNYVKQFMQNFTIDGIYIRKLKIFDKSMLGILGTQVLQKYEKGKRSLWEFYELKQQAETNLRLAQQFNMTLSYDGNLEFLKKIIFLLDGMTTKDHNMPDTNTENDVIVEKIEKSYEDYKQLLVNTTAMQEFVMLIFMNGTLAENADFDIFLKENEIKSIPLPSSEQILAELITNFRRFILIKIDMIETVQRLQEVILEKQQQMDNITQPPTLAPDEENMQEESKSSEMESVTLPDEKLNIELLKGGENNSEILKASVWQQLIQKFIQSTTALTSSHFNIENFQKKIRNSLQNFDTLTHSTETYQTLSCPQLTFWEQFSYHDFYPESQ